MPAAAGTAPPNPPPAAAPSPPATTQATPEGASGFTPKPAVSAPQAMVVTGHPLATAAGLDILDAGGSAVDAAIAAQLVLAVVEPQSSGIGGGGFLLSFDGSRVRAWDGRETAPATADETLFLAADGQPMAFFDAVVGGRSVGVPGLMRMLAAVHRADGQLPWARLFDAAIHLADAGFPVSARLHELLERDRFLRADAAAFALYYQPDGRARPPGETIRNPALAKTLRTLANRGADALYEGELAQAIVAAVRGHGGNPGRLTLADLAAYRAVERPPVCTPLFTALRRWRVCGMPPPSSGGITVAQILGLLERQRPTASGADTAKMAGADVAAGTPPAKGNDPAAATVQQIHRFAEAGRLAFADRNRYLADPDFVPPPAGLLDPGYLDARAALIGEQSLGTAAAGTPPGAARALRSAASPEAPSTTHLSVVDAKGRAVSLTSSIEHAFGARLSAAGFLLNNQLTDFSFAPRNADGPIANRVQGGKRPRSSMSPTLVFDRDSGRLEMVVGSPGGPLIINYVARTLWLALGDGLPLDRVLASPHYGSRNGATDLEAGRFDPATMAALRARGHELREMPTTSGLHAIRRDGDRWIGAADPRREGEARGR